MGGASNYPPDYEADLPEEKQECACEVCIVRRLINDIVNWIRRRFK